METRTWVQGDNQPDGVREVLDAYGDRYWRTEKGWRSSQMGYSEPDKTWWWLTMYSGPLKEH